MIRLSNSVLLALTVQWSVLVSEVSKRVNVFTGDSRGSNYPIIRSCAGVARRDVTSHVVTRLARSSLAVHVSGGRHQDNVHLLQHPERSLHVCCHSHTAGTPVARHVSLCR